MLADSNETKLGSRRSMSLEVDGASPSGCKNTGIVLVPCCACKCVPTAISGGVDITKVPGCHLL